MKGLIAMDETIKPAATLFVLSDSVGGTASNVFYAARAQFPDVPFEMKNFPFIRQEEQLQSILEQAKEANAIVLHTFVNPELVEIIEDFCTRESLTCFDVITPLINELTLRSDSLPTHKPGAKHKLDEKYFDRISALEFAVKYDDGKDPKGFLEADIVILGISRTSKTPLSIFLANQNYKVANLPLLPESKLPDELWLVDSSKIIGLTNEEDMLSRIRQERMRSYGMEPDTPYSDRNRIRKEIEYAEELYSKLGIQIINVASKSIEETAAIIVNSIEGTDA
ncbi:ATP/GTP-binding protein [Alkalibacterium sp. AK22]|uniref:pyruvate, water dikinase regulatory protein n=1 Tax=Alkalibacterium sp. AK22 TaxID=1229520 RepID=UPI00044DE114|nr:pyruvate, water dikinase regulatory protein [Alkalibacterium sp. AK22]EXJ22457.1 ATP/GTP-binding protein [Alkalibacterium sp. AK22]